MPAQWTSPVSDADTLPQATAAPTGTLWQNVTGTLSTPFVLSASIRGITCAGVDRPYIRGGCSWQLQRKIGAGEWADYNPSHSMIDRARGTAANLTNGARGPLAKMLITPDDVDGGGETSFRWSVDVEFRNDTDDGYETGSFQTTAVVATAPPAATTNVTVTLTLADDTTFLIENDISQSSVNMTGIDTAYVRPDAASGLAKITGTGGSSLLTSDFGGEFGPDIVFERIDFDAGTGTNPIFNNFGNASDGLTLVGCTLQGGYSVMRGNDRLHLWGGVVDNTDEPENNLFLSVAAGGDHTCAGIDFITVCLDSTREHHLYYNNNTGPNAEFLMAWCRALSNSGGGYFANLNCHNDVGTFVDNLVVKEMEIGNCLDGIDLSNSFNQSDLEGDFRDCVLTRLYFGATIARHGYFGNNGSPTIRDCVFASVPGHDVALRSEDAVGDNPSKLNENQCKHYKASGTNFCIFINDNLRNAHEIRDNDFQDDRTQPRVLSVNFNDVAGMASAGALISGNRFYTPNDTSGGKIVFDRASSTFKTVAEFETAIGLSGTFTEEAGGFDWNDPANGDFTTGGGGSPALSSGSPAAIMAVL